jgi:cold shock CspA family protein
MAKSQETWNKKEKEKQRQKKQEVKAQRREERKANAKDGSLENMLAYVDEYGNITSTPPDPTKKQKINADQIEVAVPRRKNEEVDINRKGTVTFFNDSKGFGFIRDSETQESIFTHINGHIDQIRENDRVTFQVEQGQKGLNAVRVKLLTNA